MTIYKNRRYLIAAVLVAILSACQQQGQSTQGSREAVVQTDSGKVLGYSLPQGGLRFASIPFAALPVGELRYLPPQPVEPWADIRDVRELGASCIQATPALINDASLEQQSEDCLWLSVTTPALDQAQRPVLVWIHGGGNFTGSNRSARFDGAKLSARGDLVFVSMQYRLGALGWMDVSSLGGAEVANSMRNGQLDQLAALEWIQRNIDQFGGDPNNVTIMGESAGSYNVAAILVRPDSQHLFHKAILQSGVFDPGKAMVDRQQGLATYMKVTGADSLEALRTESVTDIRAAEAALWGEAASLGLPDPMAFYVPTPAVTPELLRQAAAWGKPVLHGTTADEYQLFVLSMTGENRAERLAQGMFEATGLGESKLTKLMGFMSQVAPERSEDDLYLDMLTAAFMHYPHQILSDGYGKHAPVYMYLFDWKSNKTPELGAFHALDVPVVFGNYHGWISDLGIDTNNPPLALTAVMQDAWAAFARTGNPNHSGLPAWPAYEPSQRATMRFAEHSELVENPFPWMREFAGLLESRSSSDSH